MLTDLNHRFGVQFEYEKSLGNKYVQIHAEDVLWREFVSLLMHEIESNKIVLFLEGTSVIDVVEIDKTSELKVSPILVNFEDIYLGDDLTGLLHPVLGFHPAESILLNDSSTGVLLHVRKNRLK